MEAEYYVGTPTHSPVYVSGEEFLEMYLESFSGVLSYLESTDYPDESYSDTLYHHFYKLYNDVESWERTTLFVSAVYRGLFHEMFPYESKLLQLKAGLGYESTVEPYLKQGRSEEEAITAAYGKSLKKIEKGEKKLSLGTCRDLMSLTLSSDTVSSDTDLSLISELIKVLHRTNIVANHQKELKEGLLLELKHPYPILGNEMRRDLYGEKLVLSLSLLQIEPKAAKKAVDDTLSSRSHEPIISLIRDHPSKRGFARDEASAYSLGPQYTATDYIRELVLSEQSYDRIFEEVRGSAAEFEITSVLMSFEEEAGKLGQLACLEMIRELFQEDTPLLSIVNSAAKSPHQSCYYKVTRLV